MEAFSHQTPDQLGARLAIYRPGTAKIILLGILVVLLSLPCTICGFVNNTSPTVYSNSSNSLEVWLITVGLGMALVGIIAMILALGNRKLRAELYEQGFVATNKQGAKAVRWDQVTNVWHKIEEVKQITEKDQTGATVSKTRKSPIDIYALQSTDNSICEIDTSFYALSKFAPVIEQTYPRYLFPRAQASYQAGTPLTFGTLTVSSAGIHNTQDDGEAQLAWGSFNAIEVDKQKGTISIRRGTESLPWSTISLTNTPNVAVFEDLVNSIANRQ